MRVALASLLGLPLLAGCADKPAEISVYRVPAPAPVETVGPKQIGDRLRKQIIEDARAREQELREEMNNESHEQATIKGRILAAVVPNGSKAWFFKLSGPVEKITPLTESFRKFMSELKFDGATPKWTVPSGWSELPGNRDRFATLAIPSGEEKPFELTVTQFALPSEVSLDAYLLMNVNRWRVQQLGLEPTADQQLSKSMEQIPVATTAGNMLTAYYVDLEGDLKEGGGMPPMMRRGREAKMRDPHAGLAMPKRPQLGQLPFTFTLPPNWETAKGDGVSLAAFEVQEAGQKVRITVSSVGGNRLANINRWRGQVGLGQIDEAELQKLQKPIEFGTLKGDYVQLVGESRSIFGAILEHNERTWFVKLTGDTPLAAKQRESFEAFVKSVKF